MERIRISEAEWAVMEALWRCPGATTAELTALLSENAWSKNTIHTFLTRLEGKGYVRVDGSVSPKRYDPAVRREDCVRKETESFLSRVWHGAAGQLLSACIRENRLTAGEVEELRQLLDEAAERERKEEKP